MALGTPVAGAAAYSAAGGTSVAPAYPTGILATDAVLLVIGQKPSTANGGTVTTPTGWTLREELTGAGGYGTTLGADTGNTNLRIYSWDAPVAGQTGTRSVTLGTNNISWAFIVRVPTGGGTLSYGSADGQRTTTPTSPMSVALTNGASATNFQAGDLAIWAMCIPTDVTTPAQFSAQSITATGATFATAVEINEPDSATGNDIGGFSARALVTAGSSTTAPTVAVTLAGTLTNVRGPIALVRIREAGLAPVTGTLAATETGLDVFAGAGDVIVSGSMAVAEVGDDTFAATGTVTSAAISGTLAVTETGNDTFTSSGTVLVQGSLAASEVGDDSFSASGTVLVQGSLAASEVGDDTFSASGSVTSNTVTGSLAATEVGDDTFQATGLVLIYGNLSANEAGDDVFAASGNVPVSGAFSATEDADELGSYVVEDYVTSGYTKDGWEGLVLIQGGLSVSEVGSDSFSAVGTVFTQPTGITGGGIRRSHILQAAQWILDLLDKDTVKQTEPIKKVKAKLKKVRKPEDLEDLQPIIKVAIKEVQNQKKLAEDVAQLNYVINELKMIRDQLNDEEEALLMLMA